jgi:hypothetical protein
MKDSKLTKKLQKNEQYLHTVRSYEYLLYGAVSHIYILLLICISTELESDQRDLILNYTAMVSLVIVFISRSLRLTWPIYIEESLIVILLWVLLSNLLGAFHSVCMAYKGKAMGVVMEAAAATTTRTTEEEEGGFGVGGEQGHNMMVLTIEQIGLCDLAFFNIIYSFVCILLAISAFLIDFRPFFLSLLFRIIGILSFLLVILLPSSCNQFQWLHPSELIIKITLYNIVWFMNSHRRNTEQALYGLYRLATLSLQYRITSAGYHICRQRAATLRRGKEILLPSITHPVLLFERTQQMMRCIEEYIEPDMRDKPVIEGDTLLLQREVGVYMNMMRMQQRYNQDTYLLRILSWKNRAYTGNVLYLIDVARTLWILLICPFYLPLVFFEIAWSLWHIRQNAMELKELRGHAKVLYIYMVRKGDFSNYV